MTQAFSEFEQKDFATIQCHLCLQDFQYSQTSTLEKGYVVCSNCGYKQPSTKLPRAKDIALFGFSVAAVYVATIVAVLIAR